MARFDEDCSFPVAFVKRAREKGRITLGVSIDGEDKSYTVSESFYFSLGSPRRCDRLSGEDIERIREEDETYRALKCALSILSYADNSQRSLYAKLLKRGFSSSRARFATEECVRLGYVREREQLLRRVEKEANISLFGPKRIVDKLISLGYSLSEVKEVMAELSASGAVDFEENFKTLCKKKLSPEQMNIENIRALRYKYGF